MAFKILSVDDELDMEVLILQKFRKQIRAQKFEFVFANNGIQALERFKEHPDIKFVLSDINMPEMDGLTLLSKTNEMNNPLLKTVMVSAYGDMDNIRAAMNKGAFDFVTKPINFDDLDATITKTLEHIDMVEKFQKDQLALIAIRNDLDIAKEIQQSMLPKKFPPFPDNKEFDIHAFLEPAKYVGGDLFDYLLRDNLLYFIIGDVSDKGVPASLFMAMTKTLFHSHFTRKGEIDICEELGQINYTLSQDNSSLMFVTAFMGRLNIKTGELEYSYAGHEPPFVLRKGKGIEVLPKQDSLALCFDETFVFTSDTIKLNPGDALVTYTDGCTDAMSETDARFGFKALQDLVATMVDDVSPIDINNTTYARLKEFIGTAKQFDDITMLTIRFNG